MTGTKTKPRPLDHGEAAMASRHLWPNHCGLEGHHRVFYVGGLGGDSNTRKEKETLEILNLKIETFKRLTIK